MEETRLNLLANGFILTSYAFEDICGALLELTDDKGRPAIRHKAKKLMKASLKANDQTLDQIIGLFSPRQGDALNGLTNDYMELLVLLLAMSPEQRKRFSEVGKEIIDERSP